jgi:hypothetical protein
MDYELNTLNTYHEDDIIGLEISFRNTLCYGVIPGSN